MNYVVTSNEFLLIWNHTLDQKIDISQEACIFFFRLAEFFGKFLSSKSLNLSTPVASAACFLVSVLVRTLHLSIFYERSKYLDIRLGDCSLFTINLPKFRLNIKIFYGGRDYFPPLYVPNNRWSGGSCWFLIATNLRPDANLACLLVCSILFCFG